jgi:DNA-binding transcriptional regulator PaaX
MLAFAGIFAVVATSPNFLINIVRAILKNKKYKEKYNNFNEKALVRSLAGLNKNKIVILEEKNGKFIIKLSEKGKKVVKEIIFDKMEIEKQKVWDKKWRIVIFDIPENKKRKARNAIRWKLQNLNFFQLQKSVWVCPYPCEKEVQLICEVFDINPFVNIVVAEKIYNDDILRKYFKLSA